MTAGMQIISQYGTHQPVVPATFPSRLKTRGRNIIDANGFVLPVLKGFNAQIVPWAQVDFNNMAGVGANICRQVMFWDAFQPTDGTHVDAGSIAALDLQIARAQAAGIYSILDIHTNVGRTPAWVTTNATFVDGLANGTTTYRSASNPFSSTDVGWSITGTNIPANTLITAFTNAGQVTLSNSVPSGSSLSFTIVRGDTDQWNRYGQFWTNYLANRYGNPASTGTYTPAVIGMGLNEPGGLNVFTNPAVDPQPWLEGMYRTMIGWFRATAPSWIGFVSTVFTIGTPLASSDPGWPGPTPQGSYSNADAHAYDSVGGNVVYDMHDYFFGATGTDVSGRSATDPLFVFYRTNGMIDNNLFLGSGATPQTPGTGPAYSAPNALVIAQHKLWLEPFKTFLNNAQIPMMIGEWGWVPATAGGAGWMGDMIPVWNDAGVSIQIQWDFNVNPDITQDVFEAYHNPQFTITAITTATTPTITTNAAHGMISGQTANISGVTGGCLQANGNFVVTVTGSTTFTIPVTTTGTYTANSGKLLVGQTWIDATKANMSFDNLLSADQSDFESTLQWFGTFNCTVALSTDFAFTGQHCLAVTSGGGFNDTTAAMGGTRFAAIAGRWYDISAVVRAQTISRSAMININWYDNTNAYMTTTSLATVTDSTTGWTPARGMMQCPAGAVSGLPTCDFLFCGGGEVHYLDWVLVRQI